MSHDQAGSEGFERATTRTAGAVLAALLAATALAGCEGRVSIPGIGEQGSGESAVDERAPGPFTEVRATGSLRFSVEVRPGPATVKVGADSNMLGKVRTEVRNGRLSLWLDEGMASRSPITIAVAAPDVRRISLEGMHALRLDVAESSGIAIESEGASQIEAHGRTEKLDLFVAGASDVHAERLEARQARVRLEGVGRAAVNVVERLEVEISGAAMLTYHGDPKEVKSRLNGLGMVGPAEPATGEKAAAPPGQRA